MIIVILLLLLLITNNNKTMIRTIINTKLEEIEAVRMDPGGVRRTNGE